MDVNDLRRSGDLADLEDFLDGHFGATLEQYVAGAETASVRPSEGGDLAARLAALDGFEFAGNDATSDKYDGLPAEARLLLVLTPDRLSTPTGSRN
jgi:hypothetical protein